MIDDDEIETGGGHVFLLKGSQPAGLICNVEHINHKLHQVRFVRQLRPIEPGTPEDELEDALEVVLTISAADVRQMMELAARYLPA